MRHAADVRGENLSRASSAAVRGSHEEMLEGAAGMGFQILAHFTPRVAAVRFAGCGRGAAELGRNLLDPHDGRWYRRLALNPNLFERESAGRNRFVRCNTSAADLFVTQSLVGLLDRWREFRRGKPRIRHRSTVFEPNDAASVDPLHHQPVVSPFLHSPHSQSPRRVVELELPNPTCECGVASDRALFQSILVIPMDAPSSQLLKQQCCEFARGDDMARTVIVGRAASGPLALGDWASHDNHQFAVP